MSASLVRRPPSSDDVEWMAEASCTRHDPELWFSDAEQDIALAKSICSKCPVKARCGAYSIQFRGRWGVWGGEDHSARHRREEELEEAS